MAWASKVAVVVPSPATSEVFEATSLTIWAPRLASLSSSSISLATVTPSLVMVGEPHDFWMITLRPRGPKVTLTVSARISSPRPILLRALSEKTMFLADMVRLPSLYRGVFVLNLSGRRWIDAPAPAKPTESRRRQHHLSAERAGDTRIVRRDRHLRRQLSIWQRAVVRSRAWQTFHGVLPGGVHQVARLAGWLQPT